MLLASGVRAGRGVVRFAREFFFSTLLCLHGISGSATMKVCHTHVQVQVQVQCEHIATNRDPESPLSRSLSVSSLVSCLSPGR